ncbi:hemolysin III family protein [Bizionia argentinensis JUB59]|uniref:Hemolysin III family protein n=1 Tax=Bizionia argentinensis JUB59 TaxID=1046627 RepID=G2EC99_9FLAO|nr:hemolysin III family protein [Bizionia argentinensis]EGV43939.1 hemolysin III family protein [Bizionia argentinensis JUB59]
MRIQTPFEERLNSITHGIGALIGIAALVFLIIYNSNKTSWSLFSVIVYGLTIIILFSSSTLYHYVESDKPKYYLRILDHISIYFLIAGTYTPVALITLEASKGWFLFWTVWGIAAFGLILKIFFTGKFEFLSVLLYLMMGWLVVFDFSYLSENLGSDGLFWLFAGGFAYTAGILFYAIDKIKFNHVIWHLFVLAGAIFHFFMVFFYVI